MDVHGGPSLSTSLGDSSIVLYGKTLAHFYIGVREVDAMADGQSVVLGSSATPAIVDLVQYQNGSADWMTQTNVPATNYSQLRYIVDLNSTKAVFADGTSMPVEFSGARTSSSSGMGAATSTTWDATYANAIDITVNAPIDVSATTAAAVMGDFNLSESLAPASSAIIMRPALSAANMPAAITGTIVNEYGQPVSGATIVAVGSNGYAVNSAATDASGAFNVHALPADTYQLLVYNVYTNAAGYRTSASGETYYVTGFYGPVVTVTAGNTTSAGSIGD